MKRRLATVLAVIGLGFAVVAEVYGFQLAQDGGLAGLFLWAFVNMLVFLIACTFPGLWDE